MTKRGVGLGVVDPFALHPVYPALGRTLLNSPGSVLERSSRSGQYATGWASPTPP